MDCPYEKILMSHIDECQNMREGILLAFTAHVKRLDIKLDNLLTEVRNGHLCPECGKEHTKSSAKP